MLKKRQSYREFAIVCGLLIAGLAINVGLEATIATTGDEANAARSQIAKLESVPALEPRLEAESAQIERYVQALHLRASSSRQCDILIHALENMAQANDLRILGIRRGNSRPLRSKDRLPGDTYLVVIEGPYPRIVTALSSLAQAPLVTSLTDIHFTRSGAGLPRGETVAELQLQVFRMPRLDAASRQS